MRGDWKNAKNRKTENECWTERCRDDQRNTSFSYAPIILNNFPWGGLRPSGLDKYLSGFLFGCLRHFLSLCSSRQPLFLLWGFIHFRLGAVVCLLSYRQRQSCHVHKTWATLWWSALLRFSSIHCPEWQVEIIKFYESIRTPIYFLISVRKLRDGIQAEIKVNLLQTIWPHFLIDEEVHSNFQGINKRNKNFAFNRMTERYFIHSENFSLPCHLLYAW